MVRDHLKLKVLNRAAMTATRIKTVRGSQPKKYQKITNLDIISAVARA